MSSTTAERLQLLHEHIRLSIFEWKRALATGAEPNARTTHEISRSLDTLQQGVEQLEKDLQQLKNAGTLDVDALGEREDEVVRLRAEYDDLRSQFAAQSLPTADAGDLIDLGQRTVNMFDEAAARDALMGSRESPEAMRRSNKSVRFRDTLVDTEDIEHQQVLQLHERVIEEQDESLDRLSASIRNQRELSIQIGDELDSHVRLLDDVGELVDRHQTRLDGARERLDRFARTAKDHWSLFIIVILIIILVLLIAIFK